MHVAANEEVSIYTYACIYYNMRIRYMCIQYTQRSLREHTRLYPENDVIYYVCVCYYVYV